MIRENNIIENYKFKRDAWRENGNKFLETFYQILIVGEMENLKLAFRRKNVLEQHWHILNNLFHEVLGVDDASFQRGVYYEVVLARRGTHISEKEKEVQICNTFFEKSKNREYVHGAYQIHISGVLEMANYNVEAAQLYADNLLMLLKRRYGENSWQYAKMKLHIIGEYYYRYNREKFLYEIKENYNFLKKYSAECDCFFCETLAMYAYILQENADMDYEIWIERCEEAAEQKQGEKMYCFLKCKIAWIKARMLEKQNMNNEALTLLQETITKYLSQDFENKLLFYGYVYLLAAGVCNNLHEYTQMDYYAREGLLICESLNQSGSELYYNLYNYLGIMLMAQESWGEAEKFYSSSVENIESKFGRENENYIIYMNNMIVAMIHQGKNTESFFEQIKNVKSKELRKKFRTLFNNELNCSITCGDNISHIKAVYEQCIKDMEEDEDEQERKRLDTLYLSALVNEGIFEQTEIMLKNLREIYENNYIDELARAYWNSSLVWEWNKGNIQTALEIAENVMQALKEKEYEKNTHFILNYIQLLIINKQYDKASKYISFMMELLHNQILETGYGSIVQYLTTIRFLLSMYIQLFKKEKNSLRLKEEEAKWLLEKIIYCKTIERELKGTLRKYEDDEHMDLFCFRQAHRKLAALEMRKIAGNADRVEIERKRMECQLELSKHAVNLKQKVPFDKMISEYKFNDLRIPNKAIGVEYFAYYNFSQDAPMIHTSQENKNEAYSYLAFVLSGNGGETEIIDIEDIPVDKILEEEAECLKSAALQPEKYSEGKVREILEHLRCSFALPVLKYMHGKEKIYLTLDFLLQTLPMDLIFCNENEKPINIVLVDSVCYAAEDTLINFEDSNALVIGNPKFNLHGEQKNPPLPCGEIECIKIAEMFGTKAYVGEEAKQRVLWGKESKDVIHISTHGRWKKVDNHVLFQDDLFIDSFLLFAGYEDWEDGRRVKDYGNGIVTGDDFLFMDLSRTKLVVLSACESGLGFPRGLSTIHGMRWAIETAGAENTVTALWDVSDDAGAVLMVLFYRNLRIMPVSKALFEAKKALRTITVGELKSDNVLTQIIETEWTKKKISHLTNEDRPYAHWKYWAGFVCYHR